MNNKNSKNKYKEFTEDKDFDGDIEEEYEIEEDNIYKIENKLQSKISKNKNKSKTNNNYKDKDILKSKNSLINSSLSQKLNKNIKEKEYLESNISNSLISENSVPITVKSNTKQPPHVPNLQISINSEMKKKIDNENINKNNLTVLIQNSNMKLKEKKDIFDVSYNTNNSSQLDNSEFLLNKLKGNKLLQELKLKEALKNKFYYYGKENYKNDDINNNKGIVFNIIDNENNMNENLNKSITKVNKKKNKNKKDSFINRKVNQLYFKYVFNCRCKCYCKELCKNNRNRRFNTINLIRNIFVGIVICSAIGFYTIIFFLDK